MTSCVVKAMIDACPLEITAGSSISFRLFTYWERPIFIALFDYQRSPEKHVCQLSKYDDVTTIKVEISTITQVSSATPSFLVLVSMSSRNVCLIHIVEFVALWELSNKNRSQASSPDY